MDAYTAFAEVYDLFMDDVPYRKWRDFIVKTLKGYGIRDGLVCDLGCGTGVMTRLLSESGYDMIGIDASAEMLGIAQGHGSGGILYLNQDMRGFELYGTVRAVVSVCDSMNYLLEEDGLLDVFRLVNNYLDPGGIFLFDMNTVYNFRELMGDGTFSENRDEGSFIWENCFDERTRINEYALTLYIREQGTGLYRRFEETHYERGYGLDEVVRLTGQAGLKFLGAYDADDHGAVRTDSARMVIVAQEQGKELA